ncbi:MAG: FkbM family methyltransferase [Ardenticatenaceae bacterium]|nr:FkbM family methyltransferase [Ardenticatenaceae bacterium]MCB8988335.1 FkbM family methyltransferase [Ardenticatenaceae bacterium]
MSKFSGFLRRFSGSPAAAETPPEPVGERLDKHLQRLFALLEINCVLDVGANRGQYGRFLRQLGFNGRIISFEPVAADYAVLRETAVTDANWQTHPLALGEQTTAQKINITSDSLFNSFLQPNDFIIGQGLRVDQTATVSVRRLDELLPSLLADMADPKIYLKVDTQGYDLHVLAGAAGILPQVLALQSEVSARPVYDDMPDYLESIRHLNGLGYEITGLFPIARDNALRVIEFDCVMIQATAVGESTGVFPP